MAKSPAARSATAGSTAHPLVPDPVFPAIGMGDVAYLLVPVTVRQLTATGYVVMSSTSNVNKVAQRHELRTARELGL